MQIATIRGESRKAGGRKANRRVRRAGLLPGVIYGHGEAPETVSLSLHDTLIALEHQQHVINLVTDGKKSQYLLKDVQYDHLQKTPIHVDLMRVDPNERVHVKVPVELKGTPKGAHEGGVLVHVLTAIDVDCPLVQIPESIIKNIAHLALSESLHVGDLEFPDNVKPLHKPEDIVAVVRAKRGVSLDEEEGEAAVATEGGGDEPQVIGRRAKDESEADGGA